MLTNFCIAPIILGNEQLALAQYMQKGAEIVGRAENFALEAAKEITIAALQNGHCLQNDSGVCTAEYFEIVYRKILELHPENSD